MNTIDSSETMNNIGLNIHLLSFSYDKYIIKHDMRIIITTFPETIKQEYIVKSKELQFPNHILSMNINKNSKMVFIFFQKKCPLSKDPIIAWTVVETDHFPHNPQVYDYNSCGAISSDVKTFKIYEYYAQSNDKNSQFNFTEKAVENFKKKNGQIDIQLTMTEPYLFNDKHSKTKNKHVKINENALVNYNCNYNYNQNENTKHEENNNFNYNNNNNDGEITQIKLKKSQRKFHRMSKCSTDYITIE